MTAKGEKKGMQKAAGKAPGWGDESAFILGQWVGLADGGGR